VLARNRINLQLAKVSTLGERVEDTFLVDGPALQQPKAQLRIESELLDAVAAAADMRLDEMALHPRPTPRWPPTGRFDAIIDARSPAEFAEDHLPGAVNWPVLDDDERRTVGTLYVQTSPLEARKLGAAMVSRNIADHLDAQVRDKPRDWRPLVYCWRGGQRSGSLALVLGRWASHRQAAGRLQGLPRAWCATTWPRAPARFSYRVLCGRTGSGKTRLLQALRRRRAGARPGRPGAAPRLHPGRPARQPQPTQKHFDTRCLAGAGGRSTRRGRCSSKARARRIGCVMLQMPDAARVELLLEEYGFYAQQVERFCGHLDALIDLRGKATVAAWQAQARAGDWAGLFADLMQRHYDPLYLRSHRAQLRRRRAGAAARPARRAPDRLVAAQASCGTACPCSPLP
jgi:tRNA 2-selenouridine synthase